MRKSELFLRMAKELCGDNYPSQIGIRLGEPEDKIKQWLVGYCNTPARVMRGMHNLLMRKKGEIDALLQIESEQDYVEDSTYWRSQI